MKFFFSNQHETDTEKETKNNNFKNLSYKSIDSSQSQN